MHLVLGDGPTLPPAPGGVLRGHREALVGSRAQWGWWQAAWPPLSRHSRVVVGWVWRCRGAE